MYIRVVVPVNIPFLPTYYAPDGSVEVGDRVAVAIAGRTYSAVVVETDVHPDIDASRIREVRSVDTGLSGITKKELLFWKFLSEYYLCAPGEVLKAAYPKMKVDSETGAAALRARLSARAAELESKMARKKPGTKLYASMASRLEAIRAQLSTPSAPDAQDGRSAAGSGDKPVVVVGPDRVPSYIDKARMVLDDGFGVLVVAPTTQRARFLAAEFGGSFPGRVSCYLASDTAAARRRVMDNLRTGAAPYIIIGTRSALFLPFHSLGLVVVDEEQDPLLKQNEPDPRFSARDAAVMLASIHRARVILGSSFPSFETLYNIGSGKYLRRDCPRFCEVSYEMVDVSAEKRKRGFDGFFSYRAIEAVRKSGGHKLRVIYGWEDPEEVLRQATLLFPDAEIEVVGHGECASLSSVANASVFLQADAFFRRDDFRSDEKALQLFAKVAGLSRLLVIQTSKPDHNVFSVLTGDSDVSLMMGERKMFSLPPFTRLIDVIVEDSAQKRLRYLSSVLEGRLRGLGAQVLKMPVSEDRIRYRLTVPKSSKEFKSSLSSLVSAFMAEFKYSGHIVLDVDPLGWGT